MIFRYRVTLPNIKGFFRVYHVSGTNTLYEFHKRMRDDMGFGMDQQILFKALDEDGAVVARFGMFNLGSGAVDAVSISKTISLGITQFVYFYDVTNRKSVQVTLEGDVEGPAGLDYPILMDSKGPDPIEFENGYVAYEDLPEDQKHHPGESSKPFFSDEKDIDDMDFEDEPDEDEDDDDDEEDLRVEEGDNTGQIIYDGSEELNF